MKKTAIVYSFNTQKTTKIAEKIRDEFGKEKVDMVNVEDVTEEKFLAYDRMILGASTWFDGELPNFWDEFVPAIEEMDLKGKSFALFGNGDQKKYGENFVDALGILANLIESRGGEIIGYTSAKDYNFERSRALRGDQFCGLALDWENQPRKNNSRVKDWVAQLKAAWK
jgi:flavodoxin I